MKTRAADSSRARPAHAERPESQAPGKQTRVAAEGVGGLGHDLPFLDTLQPLFGGHDLRGVQAHTDPDAGAAARSIGARAYATGNHVAFAGAPDLHTAAHEAAHVVQQRAGVQLESDLGETGDPYERAADAVAGRIVLGQPAGDLLPPPAQAAGDAAPGAVQRQDGPPEMPQERIDAAVAWAAGRDMGIETLHAIQAYCGAPITDTYDGETARKVWEKEYELRLGLDGKADVDFCEHAGLIYTNSITAATVTDPMLTEIAAVAPDGVTVAIYPIYDLSKVGDGAEFQRAATEFAANQHAVGLVAGAVELGVPCTIVDLGDVLEVVQSIHRGLVERWTANQPDPEAAGTPPAYTRIRAIGLFSHGKPYGMGLTPENDMTQSGLHTGDGEAERPSNVEAFVRGIADAVTPDVRVMLFGCDAGQGNNTEGELLDNYQESQIRPHGEVSGIGSLADQMSTELTEQVGDQASVYAHTTFGHTTENFSARIFGAGPGGTPVFDVMYPETFVDSELIRLYPSLSIEERARYRADLRFEMWEHFIDSIHRESSADYERPVGQEMFIDPDSARAMLHEHWTATWIPAHLHEVTPTEPP